MTTERVARRRSYVNSINKSREHNADFFKKEEAIKDRYADSGPSGKKQMKKELDALMDKEEARIAKSVGKKSEDEDNIKRYGADAMRGRSFAQYNKGGMVKKANCGASMKPTQGKKK